MTTTKGLPVDLWTWSSNPADELRRTRSLILYAEKPKDAPSPRRVTVSAAARQSLPVWAIARNGQVVGCVVGAASKRKAEQLGCDRDESVRAATLVLSPQRKAR